MIGNNPITFLKPHC